MWITAQAMAEYGGLTSSRAAGTSSNALDRIMNQITNASATDYLLAAVALVVTMYMISKLLDAA